MANARAAQPQPDNNNQSAISKLLVTHQTLNLEDYQQRLSHVDNLTVRELIVLMNDLHTLNSQLVSLKTDIEVTLNKELGWKETDINDKLQNRFSKLKKEKQAKFLNEEEFNKIRDCYAHVISSILTFQNAETLLPPLLYPHLQREEAAARALAEQPRDFAAEHPWMSEDLGRFIGQQYKALSGTGYICTSSKEKEISEYLLLDTEELEKKQEAVGQYLDEHTEGLFFNIVSTLKTAAEADHTKHWLTAEMAQDLVAEFNKKSCSIPFFNSKPASMTQVVNFLDSNKCDATHADRQTVVSYYLARMKGKKPDRLTTLLGEVKRLEESKKRKSTPAGTKH